MFLQLNTYEWKMEVYGKSSNSRYLCAFRREIESKKKLLCKVMNSVNLFRGMG